MTQRSRWIAVASLVLASNVLGAQVDSARRPVGRGRGIPGGRAALGQANERPALEGQVRQAMARAVRTQLNLDDQKMRELRRVDAKFEIDRRQLTRDERDARQTLKAAIEDSTAGDQAKIEQAMARMIQIQRKRVDLLEAEQKDLATFLSPRQRAQYFALRERFMRRVLEMQQGGRGRRGGPPPPA